MIYHENFQASQEVMLYMWSSVKFFSKMNSMELYSGIRLRIRVTIFRNLLINSAAIYVSPSNHILWYILHFSLHLHLSDFNLRTEGIDRRQLNCQKWILYILLNFRHFCINNLSQNEHHNFIWTHNWLNIL